MQVAIWDTYVLKKDGTVMHFDIIAPKEIIAKDVIYGYGKDYLKLKGQENQELSAQECSFCHIETVLPQWEAEINEKATPLSKWKIVMYK